MPKHSMPTPELTNRIQDWLETQGYPLEMRVSRAFQEAGFKVVQSDYYQDRNSEDPLEREIDVVASIQKQIGPVLFRIKFVVECKSSANKPWILFVSGDERLASPARVAQRAGNYLAQAFLETIAHDRSFQSLFIFQVPTRPAYSFTQAFTSGADICYAAAMSIANAAIGVATQYHLSESREPNRDLLELVFPVIVTDAPLFSAFLEKNSSISLNDEKSGLLIWRKQLVGMPHTIINIVNESNLDDFVSNAKKSIELMIGLCKGKAKNNLISSQKRMRSL